MNNLTLLLASFIVLLGIASIWLVTGGGEMEEMGTGPEPVAYASSGTAR